tara:strand:+ start:63338 stop:63508 length:171 start_codon:yes stop_codon:yes gene_type:complete
VKDLRKIIALFILIFVIGTTITLVSIDKQLDKKNATETVEFSKDSTKVSLKNKKTV